MEGMRRFKYVLLCGVIYMICFGFVENRNVKYYIIHTKMDELIPFCEYFVVPYLLWFIYVAVTMMYFIFYNESKREFLQLMWAMGIGMSLFIIVSFFFPNGQHLRPKLTGEDGFFIDLVRMVYQKDTPTNIFPSIHVYNSVVCCVAVLNNEYCRTKSWITVGTVILTILIIASTVLIKQHSIIDIVGALVLNVIVSTIIYGKRWVNYNAFAVGRR